MSFRIARAFTTKLGEALIESGETKEAENLNCYIHRRKLYETYKMEVPGDITPNGFREKLVMYARMKYWNMNPKSVKYIQDDGRISKISISL